MCAALNDHPMIQYKDLVGRRNGAQPVRNRNRCAALHGALERRLHVALRDRVEG
jgi:hypothetical protein